LVLLSEDTVVVVNVLCNLGHGLQMLVKLLLLLLVVILIVFLFLGLDPEHVLDVKQLLVKLLPKLASLVLQDASELVLSHINLLVESISSLIDQLDMLVCITFKHTRVVLLQLLHALDLLTLLLVVDVDALQQVLVFGLLLDDI